MVSNLVLLATTILSVGLQARLFVNIDASMPVPVQVPETFYASIMMYCGFLHFLQDMVLLPQGYKRRMVWPMSFMIELTLSMAIMEVFALLLWSRIKLIITLSVNSALSFYGSVSGADYQQHEATIVISLITGLAAFFWTNAAWATDPWEKSDVEQPQPKGKSPKLVEKEMQQQEDLQQMQEEFEQLSMPSKYLILADSELMSSET
ncbi:uncharacterized protein LOC111071415 [Drosophila obscura]|uniref:uncharacterized protein LOC111071415 n=1 Tax=Drosophila obscura TaxID=7282 RepID=UPI000BA0F9C4|nr:uncharacterized protein LOC111071415 [Drosophila obscura]